MIAWKEQFGPFIRYCSVGIVNTLGHVVLVVSMVEVLSVAPPPANTLAFLIANIGSYAMNSRWTFRSQMSVSRYLRFFTISLVGLGITYGCSTAVAHFGLHYLLGVALSVMLVAVTGFVLGRLFVFRD